MKTVCLSTGKTGSTRLGQCLKDAEPRDGEGQDGAEARCMMAWCEVSQDARSYQGARAVWGGGHAAEIGLLRDHKHTRKHNIYDSEGFWITISRYSLSARHEVKGGERR